jgi:hypothetical protein
MAGRTLSQGLSHDGNEQVRKRGLPPLLRELVPQRGKPLFLTCSNQSSLISRLILKEFGSIETLTAVPGLSLRSNPGLKLANASGVT